jgi:hypothetical protein
VFEKRYLKCLGDKRRSTYAVNITGLLGGEFAVIFPTLRITGCGARERLIKIRRSTYQFHENHVSAPQSGECA